LLRGHRIDKKSGSYGLCYKTFQGLNYFESK
jgi:hypothetical protein